MSDTGDCLPAPLLQEAQLLVAHVGVLTACSPGLPIAKRKARFCAKSSLNHVQAAESVDQRNQAGCSLFQLCLLLEAPAALSP